MIENWDKLQYCSTQNTAHIDSCPHSFLIHNDEEMTGVEK